MLHDNCIEDCCWAERLAAAGGPTTITTIGAFSALEQGTIRSNAQDGDQFDLQFIFERLPHEDSAELLELADQLRQAWVDSPDTAMTRPRSSRQYLGMEPLLGAAIDGAVELLDLRTPQQVATWLGVDLAVVDPNWLRKRNVDFEIRNGRTNTDIVAMSTQWELPADTQVNRWYVGTRRRRMEAKTAALVAA